MSHLRTPQFGGNHRTAPDDPTAANLADVIGRAESLFQECDAMHFGFEASLLTDVIRNLSTRK